jgi:hypothetical protein
MFKWIKYVAMCGVCSLASIIAEDDELADNSQGECAYAEQEVERRYFSRRPRWKEDNFLEQQYRDSDWPARRGEELSDMLSR